MSTPPNDYTADKESSEVASNANRTPSETDLRTPKQDRIGLPQPYPRRAMKDTPAITRWVLSPSYQDGDLDSMRECVMRDVGPGIPELDIDRFIDLLLPSLKDGIDVASIVASLKRETDIFSASDNVLKDFKTSPGCQTATENDVFAPLSTICERICQTALADLPQLHRSFLLALLPNFAPASERNSSTRPDAIYYREGKADFIQYAITREKETKEEKSQRVSIKTKMESEGKGIQWYDIAVPWEVKKGLKGRRDNIVKIIFHLQQMLTLDPCRRFCFGITIEDKLMRLWSSNRSTPVVSTEFDFTKDIDHFVRIILAFSFASEEELGWDPTIKPFITIRRKRMYRVEVGETWFQTEEVLSDVAADNLLSNATRVWRAIKIGSQGQFIVKDMWIEDSRVPEHLIYENMLHDVEEMFGVAVRKEVASHLLTPIAFGYISVDGRHDHTYDLMMNGFVPSFEHQCSLEDEKPAADHERKSAGSHPNASDLARQRPTGNRLTEAIFNSRFLTARKHYRVAFEEVAINIHHLTNLSDVFVVLRDAVKAITPIHKSGWVHRDLSADNLYFYNGRGLIGDLEYAKRKTEETSHHLHTANTYFMAVEVIKGEYNYETLGQQVTGGIDAVLKAFDEEGQEGTRKQTKDANRHFQHNDLHDLESFWWIVIYILFFNIDSADSGPTGENSRESVASSLFPGTSDLEYRRDFLSVQNKFTAGTEWTPSYLSKIMVLIDLIRIGLVRRYEEIEKDDEKTDIFEDVHEEFFKAFDACIGFAKGVALKPCRPIRSPPLQETPIAADTDFASLQIPSDSASANTGAETHQLEPSSPTPTTRKRVKFD